MDFESATKRQLLQIALNEECSLADKYAACREMELRKRAETHVIELYNRGDRAYDIAYQTSINTMSICGMIGKYEMKSRASL